jgi:threonine dehydrogenase-like Zn-dependent dehydrogenase
MRAMVLRNKQLTVEEVPAPAPGPGQVLAKVRACGICGSDLHAARYLDDMIQTAQSQRRGAWYGRDLDAGMVMGHEFVAEVVEAGQGAEDWTPGTRVTSMPVLIAPESATGFLSIGYATEVPGAYGDLVVLSAPLLLKVPDGVSDTVAATTEPCAVGLHAVRESKIKPTETALVMGAGPIGLMTLIWLKKQGVAYAAVSDPAPERRELAKKMGADEVFDPGAVDLAAELDRAIGERKSREPGELGYGAPATANAPDVVFECVGVQGTLQQAMELVTVRGRVIVVGVCMVPDQITPLLGINKQLTLQFVLGYTAQEFAETLNAFADGEVDTTPLVTRTVTLDELPAAFQALADPRDCKILVVPGGKPA